MKIRYYYYYFGYDNVLKHASGCVSTQFFILASNRFNDIGWKCKVFVLNLLAGSVSPNFTCSVANLEVQ